MTERLEITEDLRAAVRAALGRAEPGSAEPGNRDAPTWSLLAREIGVAGLLAPETSGGLGLGAAEMVAVAGEIGAAAAPVPFLSHAVAATRLLTAIAESDAAAAGPLLASAAAGSRRIAVGWQPAAAVDPAGALSLDSAAVLDAPGADLLLLCASIDGETAVCAVEAGAPGLAVAEQSALDLSRSIGAVSLDASPSMVLANGGTAVRALASSRRWARLALAADQVGLARRILEITVEYTGIRAQFGAVIGSFQAVKHRCAEVYGEIELAAALVEQAATALESGEDPRELVGTAALQAGRAALSATDAAIQLHGGIGFTWEHPAHRYFRRARASASLIDSEQELRDAVAASAGL